MASANTIRVRIPTVVIEDGAQPPAVGSVGSYHLTFVEAEVGDSDHEAVSEIHAVAETRRRSGDVGAGRAGLAGRAAGPRLERRLGVVPARGRRSTDERIYFIRIHAY
ncbi:hypothetical protein [Tsukamurella soli]|uniref:Uncharacterized protein n=1 Tax=Tsukamurella soli TaxID=644556 RepID=A0ABP8JDE7_9ACTN